MLNIPFKNLSINKQINKPRTFCIYFWWIKTAIGFMLLNSTPCSFSTSLPVLLRESESDRALNTLRHANLSHSTLQAITATQWVDQARCQPPLCWSVSFASQWVDSHAFPPCVCETQPRWVTTDMQSAFNTAQRGRHAFTRCVSTVQGFIWNLSVGGQ